MFFFAQLRLVEKGSNCETLIDGVEDMHRRYQYINIPTEIVRTVVAVAELGSFSKAGTKLGLSQPAISAQMKRLQILVGGDIFEKSGSGVLFTPKGKLILAHAKKLLDANDQILSIGGAENDAQPIRLGLSAAFINQFLDSWPEVKLASQVSIVCDHSTELSKAFADGYLDIGCLAMPDPPSDLGEVIFAWEEEAVWMRSRDFVLGHGSPIPLIGWPGSPQDVSMMNAIEKAGLAYRFVLTSPDHHVRIAAMAAGIGIMGLPLRQLVPPLVVAKEYYLPKLQPVRAVIVVRENFDTGEITQLIDALKALALPQRQKASAACNAEPVAATPL
jgi:DNA-binding transcriptional LysR family regulator